MSGANNTSLVSASKVVLMAMVVAVEGHETETLMVSALALGFIVAEVLAKPVAKLGRVLEAKMAVMESAEVLNELATQTVRKMTAVMVGAMARMELAL